MDEVGLRPVARSSANWAAHIPTYGMDGNKLVLKDLITNNGRGKEPPPEINGIAPQRMEPAMSNQGHDLEYKNVNLPIHYTGTFVIKADFVRGRYRFDGWNEYPAYYESVIELTFENGILTSEKDMSKEMAERRRVGAMLEPTRKNGNVEIIKSLISNGEDVNMKDEIGQTLLHMATEQGHISLAAFLISKGADVHSKDDYGRTPLHVAENVEVARIFVSQGADVQAKNNWGIGDTDGY